jgi:DNA-binding NtrC family response regulator
VSQSDKKDGLVALVEDDATIASLVERWLELADFEVEVFPDAESALNGLQNIIPDCLLLDLNLPGMDGMQALEIIGARHPVLPVIVLTADQSVERAVDSMRLGAYDYLTKPLERTQLITTIRNATERQRMTVRLAQLEREAAGAGYADIVGSAPLMRTMFRQLDRVSPSDVTVLIRGESGTGKELVAQAIHESSGRADGPFVALNCAAIPENLQESELFGHERGAFTGATARRVGRFEQANRGTLFLDELGDLASEAQAKLLRAIQERQFQRLGGTQDIRSDFRLVSATHRDLEDLVRVGQFREDLFFRIAVFEIYLPPLRERREDIPLLVERFTQEFWDSRDPAPTLTPSALATVMGYDWPGNVRELQNAVQRGLVTSTGGQIRREDLPPRIAGAGGFSASRSVLGTGWRPDRALSQEPSGSADVPVGPDSERPEDVASLGGHAPPSDAVLTLAEIERLAILEALERTDGNVSEVATQLGIGRTTLYRKLKEYGLR